MLHLPMRLLASLCILLLSACAGNGEGLNAQGQPVSSGNAPPPLIAAFESIQDNIFTPIYVRCRSGAGAPERLQLDAQHSYALLVGVPSTEEPSALRVDPGSPDTRYFYCVNNCASADSPYRNRETHGQPSCDQTSETEGHRGDRVGNVPLHRSEPHAGGSPWVLQAL